MRQHRTICLDSEQKLGRNKKQFSRHDQLSTRVMMLITGINISVCPPILYTTGVVKPAEREECCISDDLAIQYYYDTGSLQQHCWMRIALSLLSAC